MACLCQTSGPSQPTKVIRLSRKSFDPPKTPRKTPTKPVYTYYGTRVRTAYSGDTIRVQVLQPYKAWKTDKSFNLFSDDYASTNARERAQALARQFVSPQAT